MRARTAGLWGSLAVVSYLALLEMSCGSTSPDRTATGGINGQATTGGTTGIGGQAGTGRCLDGPTGQGGSECRSPAVIVVDAVTSAVICDPTFTVLGGDAGSICDPTGDPTPVLARDGAATCTFDLESLTNVTVPVDLRIVAPGYEPTLFSQFRGCMGGEATTPVALVPIADAGITARDARGQ